MHIHFVLIAEGASDEGLIGHLENLCVEAGALEVTGTAPDFYRLKTRVGHSVGDKLRAAIQLEPTANVFFIHRDADSRDASPRYSEIADAVTAAALTREWVAVVPVQETESWLLLDERAIRAVAGRPNGHVVLGLPAAKDVEDVPRPKERLKAALVAAAQLTGRRLKKFKAEYPLHRRLLLQRLPTAGPITQISAWSRMRDDINERIGRMAAANINT